MEYDFKEIEEKWQKEWKDTDTYRVAEDPERSKYYVLDMFPYPSGAGLHVGHPLGYIASDIFARYKTHKGYNVLHPMGYDSFGLPAEQYAIQTGQHPAITTQVNIEGGTEKNGNPVAGYRKQLDRIGFSYDWSREVRTSRPDYYRWTQWIFKEIYNSWYNLDTDKAEPIETLVEKFEKNGTYNMNAAVTEDWYKDLDIEKYGFHFGQYFEGDFTDTDWNVLTAEQKEAILLHFRLTYLSDATVNWCPELGTVLANDEVKDGLSERGGHPVVQKKMKQWMMRISAYAERLLSGLDTIDWTDSIKDIQRNWIGKSRGCAVSFAVLDVLPLTPSQGGGTKSTSEPKWVTGHSEKAHVLLGRAKEMRQSPTQAEEKLWQELRNKNLGVKFRRQHPIAHYIVDFVCLDKELIIEVDGKIHDAQKEYDERRTLVLTEEKGFSLIRFTNDEVLNKTDEVITKLKSLLAELPSHAPSKESAPTDHAAGPLSLGEGRGEEPQLSSHSIEVFTTRPDTIFGVSFMVLAPEHELVAQITTPEQKQEVEDYIAAAAKKSERDRMANVKDISGAFTGGYALHPFTNEPLPIWIADYVLAGYGTGAVMAVPAGDERDHAFATHFGLDIPSIFSGIDTSSQAYTDKVAELENSDFLNGMDPLQATAVVTKAIEEKGIGYGKTNYRLRDAVFSRQRYWGEPMPVYYKNGLPYLIEKLPVTLPEVDEYLPTAEGEPPLARAQKEAWNVAFDGDHMDYNTMPGWAGSSWYYLRYMDPHNEQEFCARDKSDYWGQVDLYMGGAEHATGHLLYSRFWCKFLHDRGYIGFDEPFKKMINQGMIQGVSALAYRLEKSNNDHAPRFASKGVIGSNNGTPIHVDVSLVENGVLDIEAFKNWRPEYKAAEFLLEDGKFFCSSEVEKMSKSKYNVINPDELCERYGADTLRCYEMFLGPIEQHKPWDTNGITGVHNFLRKVARLFSEPSDAAPTKDNLKSLHKTIKKVTEDIERYSFNTVVSALMICVNELGDQKCSSSEVLRPLSILLSPYAPHLAEELWHKLGGEGSVTKAPWPVHDDKHLKDDTIAYPISFNGKMRFKMEFAAETSPKEIEAAVLADEQSAKYLDGKTPKKVIVVPKKIVNIVV